MYAVDSGVPAGRHVAPHDHDKVLCQQCLTVFVSSGNPVIDWFADATYATGELYAFAWRHAWRLIDDVPNTDARSEFKPAHRKVPPHTHEPGQRTCTICRGSLKSTGVAYMDVTGEHLHAVGTVLLIIGKYAGIVLFGLAMIAATLCPNLLRERAQEPYEERKRREWEEKRRQQREWEDARQREWQEERRQQHEWEDQRQNHWEEKRHQHHELAGKRQREWEQEREREWQTNQREQQQWEEKRQREWEIQQGEKELWQDAQHRECRYEVKDTHGTTSDQQDWQDKQQLEWEATQKRQRDQKNMSLFHEIRTEMKSLHWLRPQPVNGNKAGAAAKSLAEDDGQVREVNNALRDHENGTVSSDELVYLAKRLENDRKKRAGQLGPPRHPPCGD